MTNEQAATLEKIYDFERGLIRGILGSGLAEDKPSDQYANGYTAGQKIVGVWQWQDGFTTGSKDGAKPADPEAAKGWTAAKNLRG